MLLSLIIPCFNEEEVLPILYDELKKVTATLSKYDTEILFINDGSKDKTLSVIKSFAEMDERVKYISFSRNFGKEAAIYAGFSNASGDYVAMLDADMQDPPSLLPKMLEIIEKGEYDSVATRRVSRQGEPIIRSFFARSFYKLINKISDADIVDGARDFRLMKREMVDVIVNMSEYNRFSKGIFGWVGFNTYWMEYENVERAAGTTSWSFWGLFKYAIEGIINFSQAPLKIAAWLGGFITFLSFIFIIFVVVRRLVFGDPVQGWASTICIITFIGGVQLFCMGIMSQYIAKMYMEVKNRPVYIVSENNLTELK